MAKFKNGDEIYKVGGRYGGPCRVIGDALDMDDNGYILYTVMMKVEGGYGEFVHVFPESALSYQPDPRQDAEGDFAGLISMINEPSLGIELTPDPNFPGLAQPPKEESVEFPGYLMTRLLGSGWAAVHMVNVTVSKPGKEPYTYEDVQQTGVGRYKTQREAWVEAKMWSESDEIPFDEPDPRQPPVAMTNNEKRAASGLKPLDSSIKIDIGEADRPPPPYTKE